MADQEIDQKPVDTDNTDEQENEELNKIKEENADLVKSRDNVVNEIKDLRKKNQDLSIENESLKKSPQDEVTTKVVEILNKQRSEEDEVNKGKARQLFFDTNKEFHPDNDTGGIKMSAIDKELESLKTDSLHSVDDFLLVYNKAKKIAFVKEEDTETVPVDASSSTEPGSPKSTPTTKLTPKEVKLVKDSGWTEERYLNLKKGQPAYIESLLASLK